MSFSCHFQILLAISEIQLTSPYVLYVLYVKSAVSLKWQVGFENDMKITPIFTITYSSKMLIRQFFTSLEPKCKERSDLLWKFWGDNSSLNLIIKFRKEILKILLHINVLNDVTAAPFLVGFLPLAAEKKTPKTVQLWRH